MTNARAGGRVSISIAADLAIRLHLRSVKRWVCATKFQVFAEDGTADNAYFWEPCLVQSPSDDNTEFAPVEKRVITVLLSFSLSKEIS